MFVTQCLLSSWQRNRSSMQDDIFLTIRFTDSVYRLKFNVGPVRYGRAFSLVRVQEARGVSHVILSLCCRRALRATRPLRLVALSKRSRVSLAGGQLQVHVCTRLYGAELRGRHRRMRQEPVQTRLLQEHSRILQVSRTTSLTVSPGFLHFTCPL